MSQPAVVILKSGGTATVKEDAAEVAAAVFGPSRAFQYSHSCIVLTRVNDDAPIFLRVDCIEGIAPYLELSPEQQAAIDRWRSEKEAEGA